MYQETCQDTHFLLYNSQKKQITDFAEQEKHWDFMKRTVGKSFTKGEWGHHLASLAKRKELTTLCHKLKSVANPENELKWEFPMIFGVDVLAELGK